MSQDMEDFEQELQALKDSYAEQVPEKLSQIEALWDSLANNGWDPEIFNTFHRTVHSMAGSAPVFGFSTMGKCARELEAVLKAVAAAEVPLTEAQYKEIPLLVGAIRASAQFPDG